MNEDSFKGVAEWFIAALNGTLHFLGYVGALVMQDPPRAAIVAGGLILALAIYGGTRARLNRRAAIRNDKYGTRFQPLELRDVQTTAMRNQQLKGTFWR